MSLNRESVVNRIQAIIEAHTTPTFTAIVGEPLALGPDGSPFCCFWYLGEGEAPEGRMTLGNVMVLERFQVMCFWHRQPELATLEALETEIWQANRTLKAAFRADSNLNSTVDDLDITDSQVDYGVFPIEQGTVLYRTLEFELHVKSLTEEAITP